MFNVCQPLEWLRVHLHWQALGPQIGEGGRGESECGLVAGITSVSTISPPIPGYRQSQLYTNTACLQPASCARAKWVAMDVYGGVPECAQPPRITATGLVGWSRH